MTTMPELRLEDPDRAPDCLCSALDVGHLPAPQLPLRTVTPEQLDHAVLQLRERRGRPAAEQMLAVLRALDLTVAPRIDHRC